MVCLSYEFVDISPSASYSEIAVAATVFAQNILNSTDEPDHEPTVQFGVCVVAESHGVVNYTTMCRDWNTIFATVDVVFVVILPGHRSDDEGVWWRCVVPHLMDPIPGAGCPSTGRISTPPAGAMGSPLRDSEGDTTAIRFPRYGAWDSGCSHAPTYVPASLVLYLVLLTGTDGSRIPSLPIPVTPGCRSAALAVNSPVDRTSRESLDRSALYSWTSGSTVLPLMGMADTFTRWCRSAQATHASHASQASQVCQDSQTSHASHQPIPGIQTSTVAAIATMALVTLVPWQTFTLMEHPSTEYTALGGQVRPELVDCVLGSDAVVVHAVRSVPGRPPVPVVPVACLCTACPATTDDTSPQMHRDHHPGMARSPLSSQTTAVLPVLPSWEAMILPGDGQDLVRLMAGTLAVLQETIEETLSSRYQDRVVDTDISVGATVVSMDPSKHPYPRQRCKRKRSSDDGDPRLGSRRRLSGTHVLDQMVVKQTATELTVLVERGCSDPIAKTLYAEWWAFHRLQDISVSATHRWLQDHYETLAYLRWVDQLTHLQERPGCTQPTDPEAVFDHSTRQAAQRSFGSECSVCIETVFQDAGALWLLALLDAPGTGLDASDLEPVRDFRALAASLASTRMLLDGNNTAYDLHHLANMLTFPQAPHVSLVPTGGPTLHQMHAALPPAQQASSAGSVDPGADGDVLSVVDALVTFLTTRCDVLQLPCGHVYHGTCIRAWLAVKRVCPHCRDKVRPRCTTGTVVTAPPCCSLHWIHPSDGVTDRMRRAGIMPWSPCTGQPRRDGDCWRVRLVQTSLQSVLAPPSVPMDDVLSGNHRSSAVPVGQGTHHWLASLMERTGTPHALEVATHPRPPRRHDHDGSRHHPVAWSPVIGGSLSHRQSLEQPGTMPPDKDITTLMLDYDGETLDELRRGLSDHMKGILPLHWSILFRMTQEVQEEGDTLVVARLVAQWPNLSRVVVMPTSVLLQPLSEARVLRLLAFAVREVPLSITLLMEPSVKPTLSPLIGWRLRCWRYHTTLSGPEDDQSSADAIRRRRQFPVVLTRGVPAAPPLPSVLRRRRGICPTKPSYGRPSIAPCTAAQRLAVYTPTILRPSREHFTSRRGGWDAWFRTQVQTYHATLTKNAAKHAVHHCRCYLQRLDTALPLLMTAAPRWWLGGPVFGLETGMSLDRAGPSLLDPRGRAPLITAHMMALVIERLRCRMHGGSYLSTEQIHVLRTVYGKWLDGIDLRTEEGLVPGTTFSDPLSESKEKHYIPPYHASQVPLVMRQFWNVDQLYADGLVDLCVAVVSKETIPDLSTAAPWLRGHQNPMVYRVAILTG